MKAKWLFEKDVFEDNTDKLIEIVKKEGMEAHIVPYVPFDDEILDRCNKLFDKDDCVVFYGSLNFGKKLKKASWVPGVYLNEKSFECTSYYPAIGDLLIHHSDYVMLPYGDLLNKKEWLFENFGKNGKIFIRPNSGTKEFTGMVCSYDTFEESIALAGFYDVESDLLVLISSVKDLKNEWRFVVVDQKVVSGSLYRSWDHPEKRKKGITTKDYVLMHSRSLWEGCDDKEAWKTAQECAEKYNPDMVWTIDVAEIEGNTYKVLEIGCFSCAGMYGNDLKTVVETVSMAAEYEWRSIFDETYKESE
jgi:hypothetical protein